MSKAEPRWDLDYEVGRQAELWVQDIRESLGKDSIEVKRDRRACETGNVYVEYECKRRGVYQKSGIATTTAKLWVFVLMEGELAVIISTERLKELARRFYRYGEKHRKQETDGSHPTKGVTIPVLEIFREIARKRSA